MKEKYVRPQVVNADTGKNVAIINLVKSVFVTAVPSRKLENLPKRKI